MERIKLAIVRCAIPALLLLSLASGASGAAVVLENEHLRVEFSSQDGAITRLTNKRTQLELISHLPQSRQPWALLLLPSELT